MRKILFIIIIALLSVTGAWAQEATYTVDNLIYKVVQPATGEKYAILSGYEKSPEGILDIPAYIRVTLGNIKVPVTMIGEQAFSGCSSLTEVTIPASVVTEINNYAFTSCFNLKEITVLASNPPSVSPVEVFKYVSRDIPVYVPSEALAAYKAANVWKEFTNLQPISGTGIDATTMQESITVTDGMLHNPQRLPVCIYDLTGRQVYSGNETTIELPAGIYVVSCNGTSRKVMF